MTITGSGRDKLTKRQAQVLDVISRSIEREGYPPTIREIGSVLDIKSTNAVNDHLKALERKGYLNRNESKSRALVPVDMNDDMVDVPLVGRIAAGQPIMAVQNLEDKVRVDRFFLGRAQGVFALRVVGESMIGDGIDDGDFIFVQKQNQATPGEIVVAWIDGEATVKRYYPENGQIRFQPSNPAMEPIYVRQEDFRETQILGVVCGLYRKMF